MCTSTPSGMTGPLYTMGQVPEIFHGRFIIRGYRPPNCSALQCLLSLFDATNETWNVWTHFLPSVYFMWTLWGFSETLDFRDDSFTWPFLGYMCMSCVYTLASATAHTFNSMSENVAHMCYFLDYSAITAFGLSSAISFRAYSFPSELRLATIGSLYIPITAITSVIGTAVACETRFMKLSTFQVILRLVALGMPLVCVSIPALYRLTSGTEAEMRLASCSHLTMAIACLYIAAIMYGSHLPERLFPGRFDIVGQSHQLFHVTVIVGTVMHIHFLVNDMRDRVAELKADWEFENVGDSIGTLGLALLINTCVVILFSLRLYITAKVKSA